MITLTPEALSLTSLVKELQELEGLEGPGDLPGLHLLEFTLHKTKDFLGTAAEPYVVGVAADATGNVKTVPFGSSMDDAKKYGLTSVRKGEKVSFLGHGLPLVLPPVTTFLAFRLLLVDSDAAARRASAVVKKSGEIAGSKEAVALLVASGMAHAAAVAFVVGQALEATATAMENGRDDIIDAFGGHFGPEHLVPGAEISVRHPGADVVFKVA